MNNLFRKNKLGLAGFIIIVCLAVSAVFAPWLSPYDPAAQQLEDRLQGPSIDHPFGSDDLGRDIFSRILLGTRVSMRVGATVVLLSGLAGVLIGGFAAFIGGKLDTIITVFVVNSLMAFPGILLQISLVAFLGPGLNTLIFALVITGWVGYARLARGQVLKIKALEFVEAARALGATRANIMNQFLTEAVLICQMGGIVGIILGIVIGNVVALLLGGKFIMPWAWITLGLVTCTIVGLASGLYPALKAAKLDPIESLRYE